MDLQIYLCYIGWILLVNIRRGLAIYCFECDNNSNPSCGVYFKSYQFEVKACIGRNVKCGLQRQQPLKEKDNFIGILRRCYYLGTLPGINETDGCRMYRIPPENFTFEYCFCSEDYCNSSQNLTPRLLTTLLFPVVALMFSASLYSGR